MRASNPIEIDRAIEVFVGGFSVVRSRTYPFLPELIEDGVWLMRDAPRTKGDYRNEDYVACGVPAARMVELARQHTRGRHFISMMRRLDEDPAELKAGFKSIGYRLMWTEPLFVHDLEDIGPESGAFQIVRVETTEQVNALSAAAKSRKIKLQQLVGERPLMRQYMALHEETLIGWVASVPIEEYTWCSNLFVKPEHRRKGAARSLLNRMLKDDRAAGVQANVLLSSHTGAKLYPTVGYEMIGELMMFTPPKVR